MVAHHESPALQITNPGQRAALLTRLIKARSLLTVRFPGREGRYTSALLKVDPRRGNILLDELTPGQGHDQITPGSELMIIGRCQGVEMHFRTEVEAVERDGGLYCYKAALPEQIHYHQRREHHRVPVRVTFRHSISIGDNRRQLEARLTDLSAGGLGGVINTGGEDLERGSTYNCSIQLAERDPIEVMVQIRFLGRPDGEARRFGAEFKALTQAQSRQIERLVAELERQALRGE